MEWREDWEAVRVGCWACSLSVEAMVPPESQKVPGSENRTAPLEMRQKVAQAEAIENWNLHVEGLWNARNGEVSQAFKTKVKADWAAINARPESDRPENRERRGE